MFLYPFPFKIISFLLKQKQENKKWKGNENSEKIQIKCHIYACGNWVLCPYGKSMF